MPKFLQSNITIPRKRNKNFPADLQRNSYFINRGKTNEFCDHNIIDAFFEFFQQHRRFPGSEDLFVITRLEIPYFIKPNKTNSTNELFEKLQFRCTWVSFN